MLAADPFLQGRFLFKEFTGCSRILPGVKELYDHIKSSGLSSVLQGYILHSHCLLPGNSTKNFWQIQAIIVSELRKIRSLLDVIAFVYPDHDSGVTRRLTASLCCDGWLVTDHYLCFSDYGDSVAETITVPRGE